MGGKAKPTKHTAKEIKGKVQAATANIGGGAGGLVDRKGGKAGHSKFKCPHCGTPAPSIKSMEDHHNSKHGSLPWNPEACCDLHELHGGTTQGVAVRGTTDAKRLKDKDIKEKERQRIIQGGKKA